MSIILGTGGDDCLDMCASLLRVCGRYEARTQESRVANDHSGGSRVLVAGIVMISTMGEAIFRDGTASMHAEGIDVRFLVIYRLWDLATSVCSEYFFLAEIGRY